LDRLLEGYLDQIVYPEIYQRKKNEIIETKLIIKQKIAKSKKKNKMLKAFFKNIGSNYLFLDNLLKAGWKYEFATLAINGGAI